MARADGACETALIIADLRRESQWGRFPDNGLYNFSHPHNPKHVNEALERPDVPYGYKFIDSNVGITGKKITLPHYMAMFL